MPGLLNTDARTSVSETLARGRWWSESNQAFLAQPLSLALNRPACCLFFFVSYLSPLPQREQSLLGIGSDKQCQAGLMRLATITQMTKAGGGGSNPELPCTESFLTSHPHIPAARCISGREGILWKDYFLPQQFLSLPPPAPNLLLSSALLPTPLCHFVFSAFTMAFGPVIFIMQVRTIEMQMPGLAWPCPR